nr:integrase, catalytic region, zinc finger, CCHC-type, peptidase aspartic, catalytic [Tanacetum cinerariifolium]
MQKNLALIAKCFKKIYKPTNNNLRTSSNSKNKNVDTTLWYKNNDHSGQFGTQRTMNVAGTREKECRKPKRVKDSTYHKEKMLLCKKAEQGVPLQAEQYDWLANTNEKVDEQELEAHYSFMAKIQEVPNADSGTDSEPVEQNEQNDVESDDERVALANLIANLKLDVDENKKIQKQLKKANTTLAQELKECKAIFAETSKSLGESISVRDSCLVALQTKQTEFEKYKAFNDRTIDYDKLERKLNEALGQLAYKDTIIREGLKTKAYELSVVKERHDELMKQILLTKSHYEGLVKQKIKVITDLKLREEHDIEKMLSMEKQLKFLNEVVYKRCQSIQTIHMMAPKVSTYNGRPTFANLRYLKQAQSEIPCLYAYPYDQNSHANRLIPDGKETLALERESRSKLNKDSGDSLKFVHELKQEMHADLKYVESFEKAIDEFKSEKAKFPDMYDVILHDCVSKDVMCSYLQSLSNLDTLAELQCKGNSVDTKFDRPSVVRQPNAQRIPKPSVLAKKAVSNTNVLKPGMYRIDNRTAHTRAPQLPQTVRNSNPRVSTSTGVNHKPAVSRPSLKSNQSRDKVLPNNSQVKAKKTQVEVHPRIPSVSNIMKSVTACKDSLNSKTLNANVVCATCNKCLVDSNHFACVTKMLNDVHARTKKPNIVQLILFIVDSGYTKHMTVNLKLLCNFVEKVYYVEGLNHNLFSAGQFCDADLEVAFRKSTCFVKDHQAKKSSFKSKAVPNSKRRLNLLHMDLCGPMRVASIIGKKYILVIVDDYSRYTWTLFLRSKDETPKALKDFLTMIQ